MELKDKVVLIIIFVNMLISIALLGVFLSYPSGDIIVVNDPCYNEFTKGGSMMSMGYYDINCEKAIIKSMAKFNKYGISYKRTKNLLGENAIEIFRPTKCHDLTDFWKYFYYIRSKN